MNLIFHIFRGTVRLSSATRSHVRDRDGGAGVTFACFPRRKRYDYKCADTKRNKRLINTRTGGKKALPVRKRGFANEFAYILCG